MNPKDRVEELFKSIESSKEYKDYKSIKEIISFNDEIKSLVSEIKRLQQESVKLEYQNDIKYKEIDKEIEKRVHQLNSIPVYQEYLSRMNKLNDILSESTFQIEKYVNSKI